MSKKIVAICLVVVLTLTLGLSVALAVNAGEARAVIAADVKQEAVDQIYKDFGVERGSVAEITVTNAMEREYLEGLVADEKIGNVALSCVYIETLEAGSGLQLSIMNIKWCTEDMYINALATAGITDAKVVITAPHSVTGTAALTGIYVAYEDITGQKLDTAAKQAAAEELVVTGELADVIGSQDATQLINELKGILDQTQNMTDDELREEILAIAEQSNIELTEEQLQQIMDLVRKLEKLDVTQLQSTLEGITGAIGKVNSVGNFFSDLGQKISGFFKSVGEFFSNLFGG